MTAAEWASLVCSQLESAIYLTPRGKQAESHSNILQLVRINAPSVVSVLNSVKELADADQLSSTRRHRKNSSDIKNSQSTLS